MSTFDDPNRESLGLDPIWTGAGNGEPEPDPEPEPAPQRDPFQDPPEPATEE